MKHSKPTERTKVKVVLPGDTVSLDVTTPGIILGPGLIQAGDSISCTKAGFLVRSGPTYWVENDQKRYIPETSEHVVGRISGKGGEFYRVDIGSAHQAILPFLAFENATKKNRPNLNIGDLIYARVALANKDMDPELQCYNPTNNKAEGFGKLEGGMVLKCSLRYCQRLLTQETDICKLLGQVLQFEVSIGMNGRVWLSSDTIKHISLVYNVLKQAEALNNSECKALVNNLVV
ncbi:40039_t:CDS:2 [Gigaspora margarita]|uniref:40039_t:CDS:1 n=2 Tax=Gigaspora margarita TaxID=4874 RepID=A0ABN7UN88_GIGMA|nr:putative exosome complex component rrp40 [Gigaspora margarita]CAG8618715.1 40039_t:CDS:2 [Gigaspora margarita]